MKKIFNLTSLLILLTAPVFATTVEYINSYNSTDNKLNATDLSTIIKITNLGPINMGNATPVKKEILQGIKDKNPTANDLKVTDFIFKDTATATNVTIIGIGKYTGEIDLYYSKKDTRVDLNTIITTADLGDIVIASIIPTKEELLKGIKDKNPTASDLTINDFYLTDLPSLNSANLIGTGNYKGEIKLQYSQKDVRIDLATIITTPNLEQITISGNIITRNELLTAIQAKNPETQQLTPSDFGFDDNPSDTSVTIVGIGNYKGMVELTYTLVHQN